MVFCTLCGLPAGSCAQDCPSKEAAFRLNVEERLSALKASSDAAGARGNRRRGAPVSKPIPKVNVTAIPYGFDKTTGTFVKLSNVPPVNVVFLKSASYLEVELGVADALFPSPVWQADAEYQLATHDGALIKPTTVFSEFPFNLGSGGKAKKLLVYRRESSKDNHIFSNNADASVECTEVETTVDHDVGRTVEDELVVSSFGGIHGSISKKTTSVSAFSASSGSAFGDMTGCSFGDVYAVTKDDSSALKNPVAILHTFANNAWSQKLLDISMFDVPNMEDPVEDGQMKIVFKDALFRIVFGDAIVVFKCMKKRRYDTLKTVMRNVQTSSMAAHLAQSFNGRLVDKKHHIQFMDACALELLPDAIDLLPKSESVGLREMYERSVFWQIERQIKCTRFEKFVSNQGAILDLDQCTTRRSKAERLVATAFAHDSFVISGGRLMVQDLQGWASQLTDPEIVTAYTSVDFGMGNVSPDSITTFFDEHKCNLVCSLLGNQHNRPVLLAVDVDKSDEEEMTCATVDKNEDVAVTKENADKVEVVSEKTEDKAQVFAEEKEEKARVVVEETGEKAQVVVQDTEEKAQVVAEKHWEKPQFVAEKHLEKPQLVDVQTTKKRSKRKGAPVGLNRMLSLVRADEESSTTRMSSRLRRK